MMESGHLDIPRSRIRHTARSSHSKTFPVSVTLGRQPNPRFAQNMSNNRRRNVTSAVSFHSQRNHLYQTYAAIDQLDRVEPEFFYHTV